MIGDPGPYTYRNITSATTTEVADGSGVLGRIVVNKAAANGSIAIWDSLAASGAKIGTITFPATLLSDAPVSVDYECAFGIGLTIVTVGAVDLTVVYR